MTRPGQPLVAALACCASFACRTPPAAKPTAKDPESVARGAVAARLGVDPASLAVVARANATYPHLEKAVSSFKVKDRRGGLHGVAVTKELKAVDPAKLSADDEARRREKNGALDEALVAVLARGGSEKLAVVLWLVERGSRPPERPAAHGEPMTPEAIDGVYKASEARRTRALEAVVPRVLERVKRFDPAARPATLSPIIAATLAPPALRELSRDPDIDRIYLDLPVSLELDVARVTTAIDVVHVAGLRGAGVKIALTEPFNARVENNSWLLGPVLWDPRNQCPSSAFPFSEHATGVAGAIKGRRINLFGALFGDDGSAPEVELLSGGNCVFGSEEMREATSRAMTWGARAINLSWGFTTNNALNVSDRAYDGFVFDGWRTIVKSAGNKACAQDNDPSTPQTGSAEITSPGKAYNVISVGGFDDKNTVKWDDDTMYPCSSRAEPISTNNDRKKPEIAAPAVDVLVPAPGFANQQHATGTSIAAPLVTGTAALLIQRVSRTAFWPEIMRAVLMATATHNIEGATRLSDQDGAGGLVAGTAKNLLDDTRRWDGIFYSCASSTASPLTLATLSAGPRTNHRVVISWDADPSRSDYNSQPGADIDLEVVDAQGRQVAASLSFDNTFEIVEFSSWLAGTYSIRAVKFRCDQSFTWLGWAWHTFPMTVIGPVPPKG